MNRGADQPSLNPLREGISIRAVPQPCTIVIFGATGDLTHRKLIPALYNLAADGDLPPAVTIVGFARREKSDDQFRNELENASRKFSRQTVRDDIWKTFAESIFYHRSEFEDEGGYKTLAKRLNKIDKESGTRGNRLFYLAAAPDQFESILKHLKAAGLNETCKGSWARVIVEKPFGADSIRDEKVKVIRSLRHLSRNEVAANVVRGQYTEGAIHGDPVVGYRQEQNVKPDSHTETFVALRLFIDNWRWADVPIYMRVGKRLPKSATEISVHFKKAPPVLFNKELCDQNVLVIRIQPDEGISLRIHAKVPGASFRIEPVKMDFHYGTSFGKASPEAYERLLLDAMSGDATLFARRDEVEEAWAFIDPIEEAWHAKKDAPGLFLYPAGSWGPEEADDLLARDGRAWRRL